MSLISSDQENLINQILEKGIDQFKKIPSTKEDKRIQKEENIKINSAEVVNNKADDNKKSQLKTLIQEIKRDNESKYNYQNKYPTMENNYSKDYKSNPRINEFSNFRTELSDLQTNIDKLEKKLFENGPYSFNSPLSTLNNNITSKQSLYKGKEDFLNYTKNVLEKSGGNLDNSGKDKIIYYEGNDFDNLNIDGYTSNIKKYDSLYSYSSTKKNKEPEELYIDYNSYKSDTKDNPKILHLERELQEKQLLIKDLQRELREIDYRKEDVEREVLLERQRNDDLIERLQRMEKYSDDYYELNIKYAKLLKDHDLQSAQLDKSEKIRLEQSKLIKSLQREIDILRENYLIKHTRKDSKVTTEEDKDKRVENPFLEDNLTTTKKKETAKTKKAPTSKSKTPVKKIKTKTVKQKKLAIISPIVKKTKK